MFWKLLASAIFAALTLLVVESAATFQQPENRVFAWAIILLAAGYQRELRPKKDDGRGSFFRLRLATEKEMRMRYLMWGIPLNPARRVIVPAHARSFAENHRRREALRESLPVLLRWLVRRRSEGL